MNERVTVSVLTPKFAPPEGTQLVVFASAKNYTPEYDSSRMLIAARRYARQFGVYVVPERFVAGDYLCLCLISPAGELLGVQRACHLNLDYRGVFRRSDTIDVIETNIGKIALIVDVDANMPQIAREATRKGATLLVQSQFVQLYDFFEERITHSALNAALSNEISVVATISGGGILIDRSGDIREEFSELLPLTATLSVSQNYDHFATMTGFSLMMNHRDCLVDRAGGNE